MKCHPFNASLIVAWLATTTAIAAPVWQWVEAESFQKTGGWVVDQQFMDQMGSPYLLAHGLGTPVADATTEVTFSEIGNYRVWVRTKDWVPPHAPGRFKLVVDGKELDTEFGTVGQGRWIWHEGPSVSITKEKVTLGLKDVTGFEGRCDAILFVKGDDDHPPEDAKTLAGFRRQALGLGQPVDAGPFDLVVVGGGLAGISAAVSAARLDLRVALIQDRPVLGGNNSSEIGINPLGKSDVGPFPRNADILNEVEGLRPIQGTNNQLRGDQRRLAIVEAEPNIKLFLNTHVVAVEKERDRITAVVGQDIRTGKEWRFSAPLFADCTGDGNLGYLAGADYRQGRESRADHNESLAPEQADRVTLGTTCHWRAKQTITPSAFPECPWAIPFTEQTARKVTHSDWDWESGMRHDTIEEAEFIRDYNLRVIYGNWAFLKNHSADKEKYANWRLDWVAFIAGKRESRRLMGDVILRQQDLQEQVKYPDACVTATWSIDLHYPETNNSKFFPGEEFFARFEMNHIQPYTFPFRCLYSRNISNLLMAGRNISVTHVALGSVRVQRTTAMMGTVVGRAAVICKKHRATPRQVYERHLPELLHLLAEPEKNTGSDRKSVSIDTGFPGGNVVVKRIEGDAILLQPDLRDTPQHWFYWYFGVRGAEGRTLTFNFDVKGMILGARGPAVSLDQGKTWKWLGTDAGAGTSFCYTFPADAQEVRFSCAMPYVQSDLDRFLSSFKGNPYLRCETLCKTSQGREAEVLRVGCVAREPKHRALFTARHHACEMMVNYAIEGLVAAVLTDNDTGRWLRENVEFLIVPFMDKDGVENGDQGKSRKPHDTEKDWGHEPSLYPTVAALKRLAPQWSRDRLRFYLDMHCPLLKGGMYQEYIYFCGAPDSGGTIWPRVTRFAELVQWALQKDSLPFHPKDNLPFNTDWNSGAEGNTPRAWMAKRFPEALSASLELPYANAKGMAVDQNSARAFGRDLAQALSTYLKETNSMTAEARNSDAPQSRMARFFSVEQQEGRWWFIGPDGTRFISKGVDTVRFTQDRARAGSSFLETALAKYGSEQKWREMVARQIFDWGFNTLGGDSDEQISSVPVNGRCLAYAPIINLGSRYVSRKMGGSAWSQGLFPDVFDPDFEVSINQMAQERCASKKDDLWLLGYFVDNELSWGPDWRGKDELLIRFLALPANAPGRLAAIQLLRDRYQTVTKFNQTWAAQFGSWDELATAGPIKPPMEVKGVWVQNQEIDRQSKRGNPQYAAFLADCDAFLAQAAERYFRITHQAIKTADPNHLDLGCRFAYVPARPVVSAAAKYVDVISFNCYSPDPRDATEAYADFGKPVLIGEFSFKGRDSGLPNTRGAGPLVETQADRAEGFRTYVSWALSNPNLVGYHWFRYADQPKESAGENSNFGIVTIQDDEYPILVKAMRVLNEQAETVHRQRSVAVRSNLELEDTIYLPAFDGLPAWQGNFDLFVSVPNTDTVRQVVFMAQEPNAPNEVRFHINGEKQSAPPVRWTVHPKAGVGYELTALIPLSLLAIQPDKPFLAEMAVSAVAGTDEKPSYVTLFQSLNAYWLNTRFALFTPTL